jgi:hypothetical protein
VPEVAERLARIGGLSASAVDTSTVLRTKSLSGGAKAGYFQTAGATTTSRAAIRSVMSSVWGDAIGGRTGLVRFVRMGLAGAPNQIIESDQVVSFARAIPEPSAKDLELGWRRAWTVQDGSTLAGNATDAYREFVGKELRRAGVTPDTATTDNYLEAQDLTMDTLLTEQSDAETEAQRRFDLLKGLRHLYTVVVTGVLHQLDPADIVRLYYDEFGLEDGAEFVARSVADNTNTRNTTLELWG